MKAGAQSVNPPGTEKKVSDRYPDADSAALPLKSGSTSDIPPGFLRLNDCCFTLMRVC